MVMYFCIFCRCGFSLHTNQTFFKQENETLNKKVFYSPRFTFYLPDRWKLRKFILFYGADKKANIKNRYHHKTVVLFGTNKVYQHAALCPRACEAFFYELNFKNFSLFVSETENDKAKYIER